MMLHGVAGRDLMKVQLDLKTGNSEAIYTEACFKWAGLFDGLLPFDSELQQDIFHQAPPCEGGLKKV